MVADAGTMSHRSAPWCRWSGRGLNRCTRDAGTRTATAAVNDVSPRAETPAGPGQARDLLSAPRAIPA